MINKKKIATLCLVLALFFNPVGYDALFKMTMELTGSYWAADTIFYCIAASFLGLYFYFANVNPFNHFIEQIKALTKKIRILFNLD